MKPSRAPSPRRVVSRRALLNSALAGLFGITMLAVAGCSSSTKVQSQDSVGRQLLELEESYQKGIITEREYNRLKKAIIRAND